MEERKYVLITGSSSGIGEEIAIQLSRDFNIILNGRNEERLTTVRNRLSKGDHLVWRYDLDETGGLEASIQQFLDDYQIAVTYFVHSAGFMKMFPIKMLTADLFAKSFNINVIAAALITKVLVSRKNQKALRSAVFISSNISNFGARAFSVYSAAKSGLDGLMRSLAMELAPQVRINSVLPGGVRTRMTEQIYEDVELIKRIEATYPLGLGNVNDIYNVVRFLISEESRWITGQQITVDGGRTINVSG